MDVPLSGLVKLCQKSSAHGAGPLTNLSGSLVTMDKAYFQDQKVGNPIAQKEVSGATELLQTMKLKKAQTGMPVYQCNSCCRQTSCTCNLNSNCFIHSNQCPSGCAYVAFQLVPPPPAASPMSSSLLAPGNYKFMVTEDLKVVDASVVKAMEFIQAHAGDMTKIKTATATCSEDKLRKLIGSLLAGSKSVLTDTFAAEVSDASSDSSFERVSIGTS
ncbi:unnamed protein product [Effrenium voratum]|nr:unnamed protein product [Effrenium voratum]